MIYVISAAIGLVYGGIFAVINNKILINAIEKIDDSQDGQAATNAVMKTYLIRYAISVLALVAVIFICKFTPWHFISTIIATAVGLTVPGQIILRLHSRKSAAAHDGEPGTKAE